MAVIVAVPTERPVIAPLASTEATAGFELFHTTDLLKAFSGKTVYASVCVSLERPLSYNGHVALELFDYCHKIHLDVPKIVNPLKLIFEKTKSLKVICPV